MNAPTVVTRKPFAVQPAGYLMGWFGVLVLLSFLLLAAWNGQTAIVILLGIGVAAAGLARLWSRMSLVGVTCQRTISDYRLFPGEYLELKLSIANRKILPVPWVQVTSEIPMGLSEGSATTAPGKTGVGLLSRSTALLWYTTANWRCRLHATRRGYYPLGNMTVTSGDIFGFYPGSATVPSSDHVIVYPMIYTLSELDIPSLYPLGETVAERRIFEDPTRAIGVRDYTPRDSLRHIHWKASARHQTLQVKVFEPSTTVKVALFLAVDSFWWGNTLAEEDLEMGISTAASVARYAVEHGCTAGLYVNSLQTDSGLPVRILPGGDAGHLVNILEALAKVTQSPSISVTELFQSQRRELPLGTTFVLVLSNVSPAMTDLLTSLKHGGHRVLVLQVGGDGDGGTVPEIPWHRVGAHANCLTVASQEGQ